MYEDKTLKCKECGAEFIFSAGEQEFYAEKGFQNEPQRCKECRNARKNAAKPAREMFIATCASCGGEACPTPYRHSLKHVLVLVVLQQLFLNFRFSLLQPRILLLLLKQCKVLYKNRA